MFDTLAEIVEANQQFGQVRLGISTQPMEEILGAAQFRLMLIAAAELVLVALFSIWLGRYLSRGIQSLTQGAAAVAKGQWDYRLTTSGQDEISEAGKAFNYMLERFEVEKVNLKKNTSKLAKLNVQVIENEAYMRTILESLEDGVVTIDGGQSSTASLSDVTLSGGDETRPPVPDGTEFLATWMQQAGYATALVSAIAMVLGLAIRRAAVRSLGDAFTARIVVGERVVSGPYRWLDHPSELGLLLASLGFAGLCGSGVGLLAWVFAVALPSIRRCRAEDHAWAVAPTR